MQLVTDVHHLRKVIAEQRALGRQIGFVPTMGNLHAGHYSLLERARDEGGCIVASIFVNPTQFGPNEDFARYPRTPAQDAEGLAAHGCDVLFQPDVETMYPFGLAEATRIEVLGLGDILEGAIRPGHFSGVASVVARLFNLVQPDFAVFGQKDYQQLLVIQRMSLDLGFHLRILGAPIVREPNGLAMSSRNQYLDADQRGQAALIHATLQEMRVQVLAAKLDLPAIEIAASERLQQAGFIPDYVVIRRRQDLAVPGPGSQDALIILIAARCGSVRLIDNLWVDV